MQHLTPTEDRQIVNTFLQELAVLLLASSQLKGEAGKAAERGRGQILGALDKDNRALYVASRDVIIEFAKGLAGCKDPATLSKILTFVQDMNQGNVYEYAEVKDRIVDQPGQ